MNVTLLGTGCSAVDTVRYGPSQIICHDDQVALVDCGSGVSQRLLAAGVPGRDVDAVMALWRPELEQRMAREAGVECLVLTHFVPPERDREALLAEVTADFAGPVIVGEDLMTIDPARRTVVHGGAVMALGRRALQVALDLALDPTGTNRQNSARARSSAVRTRRS